MLKPLLPALLIALTAIPAVAQDGRRDRDRWTYRGDYGWDGDRHDGVHLRIGSDYHVPAGTTSSEPVVVIAGNATIDGRVDDDVVVIGGRLTLGPTAVINGDAVALAGTLTADPAARVSGDRTETSFGWPDWRVGEWHASAAWWNGVRLVALLGRLALTLFAALLFAAVAPAWLRQLGGVLLASPGVSVLAGVGAEILIGPAIAVVVVALVISIVGIPLLAVLPIALALGALTWVSGFAAVAAVLGARLRGRNILLSNSLVGDVLLGFVVLTMLSVVGQLLMFASPMLAPMAWLVRGAGFFVEYLAWTLGLGVLIALLLGRRGEVPPPVPGTGTLVQPVTP